MPRITKDSGAAPAIQTSRETSTVGKGEKSVNPNVPPESFPTSVSARNVHLVKRIFLTAVLSVLTFVLFLGFATWNQSSLGFADSVSVQIASSPPSMGGYPHQMGMRVGKVASFNPVSDAAVAEGMVRSMRMPPYSMPIPEENAATPTLPDERKVIKDGNLTLLVPDISRATEQIKNITAIFGGFVESVSFQNFEYPHSYGIYAAGQKRASVSVRIPAEQFDRAVGSIKALATRVESESFNSNDVSAQYVDLEARLKNLQATEKRYLALIDDAKNVEEVLKVESYLSNTRENIERIQGQLNFLSRQVAMSTIFIDLVSEPSPTAEKDAWRPNTVFKQALQDLTKGLIEFANRAITFAVLLPILLIRIALWVVIGFALWKAATWLYRRVRGKILPPAGGVVS
jgi:hypothetical protein